MSAYKVQQRHLPYRGRVFHFVSYEGEPANAAKLKLGTPPAWFYISSGKRWMVMDQVVDLPLAELDKRLGAWLDTNVFD
jgi:hypothetical protein